MDKLEKMIRDAFEFSKPLTMYPDEDVVEINQKLSLFPHEGLVEILPFILLREKVACEKNIYVENSELIIYFLDGALLDEPKERQECTLFFRLKQETFEPFSKKQALAIASWLEEVALPKYKKVRKENLSTVKSALYFWKKKAKGKK